MLEQFQESFENLVDKLEGWMNGLIVLVPNILLAAIVAGLGFIITKYIRRWVEKSIRRFSSHQAVNSLAINVITAGFVMLILLIILSILNLDTALKSMLAGAGVAGLAIGLALQDPIMNVFSGIMMSTKHAFRIGDLIETNGYFGTIRKITLRTTFLATPQGEEVMIPNKTIYQNPLKNYSVSKKRRVDLSCGVSYGDDLEKVKKVAIAAIEDKVSYDSNKDVELFFNEFGGSSINFQLRFWLKQPDLRDYLAAQSEAIVALKQAFDDNDIMIPYPIRTLDFGIRGGEKLDEMLAEQNGRQHAEQQN